MMKEEMINSFYVQIFLFRTKVLKEPKYPVI